MNSRATDGSQTLVAVLQDDIDTASGDSLAVVYITGSFLASKLLFGGTDTLATHFSPWTGRSIAVPAIFAEPSTQYQKWVDGNIEERIITSAVAEPQAARIHWQRQRCK